MRIRFVITRIQRNTLTDMFYDGVAPFSRTTSDCWLLVLLPLMFARERRERQTSYLRVTECTVELAALLSPDLLRCL